ncbi:unnamed protein product [Dimorphilus gyrociliatus]|uniref:Uncharacterized protein n=1 Tax=Dimorphilus gyrociliatus TaxID=2664684 RepID=A0A7I8V9R5_9ANNE|nr:unnamed protein product [Dimorphilus gyrociliatus]
MSIEKPYEFNDKTALYTDYVTLASCGLGLIGCAANLKISIPLSKTLSAAVFMAAFSICDGVQLIIRGIESVFNVCHAHDLTSITSYDALYGSSNWRCRVGIFSNVGAKILSTWLVCALVAEFCITKKSVETSRNWQVAMTSTLIAVAACFPFVVMAEGNSDTSLHLATPCTSSYRLFFDFYLRVVVELVAANWAPVLVTLFCSVKLLIKVFRGASINDRADLCCKRLALTLGWTQIIFSIPFIVTSTFTEVRRFSSHDLSNDWLKDAHIFCRLLSLFPICSRFYLAAFLSPRIKKAVNQSWKCGRIENQNQKQFYGSETVENSAYNTRSHLYTNDYNSPKVAISHLDSTWF